jgi:hypothetical protein
VIVAGWWVAGKLAAPRRFQVRRAAPQDARPPHRTATSRASA